MEGGRKMWATLATMVILVAVVSLIAKNTHEQVSQGDAWSQGFIEGFVLYGGPVLGVWPEKEPLMAGEDGYSLYRNGDAVGLLMAMACWIFSMLCIVWLMFALWGLS